MEKRLRMEFKLMWAKHLFGDESYKTITENLEYIEKWQEVVNQKAELFQKNQIVMIGGNLTISKQFMTLEFVLVNCTNKNTQNVSVDVTLVIRGTPYFRGILRNKKNMYQELAPNEGRLDIVDFVNDRFDDAILKPGEYELIVHGCKEVIYKEKVKEA